jgi:hypothetical protein
MNAPPWTRRFGCAVAGQRSRQSTTEPTLRPYGVLRFAKDSTALLRHLARVDMASPAAKAPTNAFNSTASIVSLRLTVSCTLEAVQRTTTDNPGWRNPAMIRHHCRSRATCKCAFTKALRVHETPPWRSFGQIWPSTTALGRCVRPLSLPGQHSPLRLVAGTRR